MSIDINESILNMMTTDPFCFALLLGIRVVGHFTIPTKTLTCIDVNVSWTSVLLSHGTLLGLLLCSSTKMNGINSEFSGNKRIFWGVRGVCVCVGGETEE